MNAMLIDCWAERMDYPTLLQAAIREWNEEYSMKSNGYGYSIPRRADCMLVENKASGHALIPDLRKRGIGAVSIERNKQAGDKTSRVHGALPYLANGQLWLPESTKGNGAIAGWAEPFVKQLEMFKPGGGGHDDYVDSWSQAILYMRASSLLDIQEYANPVVDFEQPERKFVNPYS
jgi:predicted phage terminase large subunit-like protein